MNKRKPVIAKLAKLYDIMNKNNSLFVPEEWHELNAKLNKDIFEDIARLQNGLISNYEFIQLIKQEY